MTRARVTAIVLAAITVLQIRAALHSRCCVPGCGGDGVSSNGEAASGLDALGRGAGAVSAWVTGSYKPGTDPEVVLWRRVTKVCEEAGEVWRALAGMLGENPRKGVTCSVDEVIGELLDTALAALGAVEHLTGDQGLSGHLLAEKLDLVLDRAVPLGAVDPRGKARSGGQS